jgi:hypothetical protein
MNRTLLLLAVVLSVLVPSHLPAADAVKPNFIFILMDDMGWRDLGCYGSDFHETPKPDYKPGARARAAGALLSLGG